MKHRFEIIILIPLVFLIVVAQAQDNTMAQNDKGQTIINQNVTSNNQSGGITAHTVVIGPGRLEFTVDLGNQLLAKMPTKKLVRLVSVGSNRDQIVGNEIQSFLQNNGYAVHRSIIGMMGPPPDNKISLRESADSYELLVAPSVN